MQARSGTMGDGVPGMLGESFTTISGSGVAKTARHIGIPDRSRMDRGYPGARSGVKFEAKNPKKQAPCR